MGVYSQVAVTDLRPEDSVVTNPKVHTKTRHTHSTCGCQLMRRSRKLVSRTRSCSALHKKHAMLVRRHQISSREMQLANMAL
jgi:hypothetical protein